VPTEIQISGSELMSKQLMIYERAAPVSSDRHRDWSVRMGQSYGFARDVNSAPLLAAEFLAAARSYAVVFAGNEDEIFPSVVLGLKNSENAYVDADGNWTGQYIPAFLRRYPFVFSRSEDGATFTLCIDEEYEDFNTEGRGERLFDADGNRTQFLETMLNFTREYQALFDRTQQFCRRLKEHDLLEAATAQFTLPGGATASLAGFYTISREKLKALPPETLAQMLNTDELELCYAHLHSLGNLTPMAQKTVGDGADAAAQTSDQDQPKVEPVSEDA
jgi:hypothetical protein